MTRAALVAGIFGLILASSIGGPSLTSALVSPESRYTDLTRTSCEPGPTGRDGPGTALHCPGLGGARVILSLGEDRVGLGFAWSTRETAADVAEAGALQPRLEWRGLWTSKGFEPYAVLVRTGWGRLEGRESIIVVQVRPGEACQVEDVAWRAGLDLAEAARAVADTRARVGSCKLDGRHDG